MQFQCIKGIFWSLFETVVYYSIGMQVQGHEVEVHKAGEVEDEAEAEAGEVEEDKEAQAMD